MSIKSVREKDSNSNWTLILNTHVIVKNEAPYRKIYIDYVLIAEAFGRVINLCELIYENDSLSRDEITNNYDFDTRQTNYYTDACRYLGLINKNKEDGTIKYFLTEKGRSLFSINIRSRNLKFAQWILQHKAFYLTFKQSIEEYKIPSLNL